MDLGLLPFLKWAVNSGVLPAGTAVILIVFCFLIIRIFNKQSKDFTTALTKQEEAHQRTAVAIREQVAQQGKHIEGCEKRYEQMRTDMNLIQQQVGETHETLWREVLTYLRK